MKALALADTLEQLQAQVDAFDLIYNTDRPHQGLPGRITPTLAWAATPVVEPPRSVPQRAAPLGNDGLRMTRIHDNVTVYARGAKFQVSRTLAGQIAYRAEEDEGILIFDAQGTLLTEYPWPEPGTKYVGSGNPANPTAHTRPVNCYRCPET